MARNTSRLARLLLVPLAAVRDRRPGAGEELEGRPEGHEEGLRGGAPQAHQGEVIRTRRTSRRRSRASGSRLDTERCRRHRRAHWRRQQEAPVRVDVRLRHQDRQDPRHGRRQEQEGEEGRERSSGACTRRRARSGPRHRPRSGRDPEVRRMHGRRSALAAGVALLLAVSGCTQESQNRFGRALQNWTGDNGVLDVYGGDKLLLRFIKIDKLTTSLGTSHSADEPRPYRFGSGISTRIRTTWWTPARRRSTSRSATTPRTTSSTRIRAADHEVRRTKAAWMCY